MNDYLVLTLIAGSRYVLASCMRIMLPLLIWQLEQIGSVPVIFSLSVRRWPAAHMYS